MSKVVCEVSCWKFLTGQCSTVGRPVEVDNNQIETLTENNQQGDKWHFQNIQINKVIGENEKCNFHFTEKTKQNFWPTQYVTFCVCLFHLYACETLAKGVENQGSHKKLDLADEKVAGTLWVS